jgi:hypothetical protein
MVTPKPFKERHADGSADRSAKRIAPLVATGVHTAPVTLLSGVVAAFIDP